MKSFIIGLILLIFVLLNGCDEHASSVQTKSWCFEGRTMGTYYRVLIINPPIDAIRGLNQEIKQTLLNDNHQISTWQEDTIISKFNHYYGTEPQPITIGIADIISTVLYIGKKTDNAMDVTIGPLVNLWGFGPEKKPIHIPNIQQIEKTRAHIGLKNLKLIKNSNGQWLQKLIPDIYVDLSTVGEGYATDHLAAILTERGINRYLVSVGGAILASGFSYKARPWRVAIQQPTDKHMTAAAIVNLTGYGISTAGSYRNYYELDGKRISHIINPVTGKPISHKLVSATVIAKTALEADGWDTGLMVLGTEKAKKLALQESLAVFLITKTDHGFDTWMSPKFSSFIDSNNQSHS